MTDAQTRYRARQLARHIESIDARQSASARSRQVAFSTMPVAVVDDQGETIQVEMPVPVAVGLGAGAGALAQKVADDLAVAELALEAAALAVDQVRADVTTLTDTTLPALSGDVAQAVSDAAAASQAAADVEAGFTQLQTDVDAASQAASDANAAAQAAAGLAAGKGEVIYQASAPTGSRANAANLWIRSSDNKPHTYNGSSWVAVESKVATDAAAAAAAAQGTANTATTTANAKNRVVWSTSAASGTTSGGVAYRDGDVWFRKDANGLIIGQWEFVTGAWAARTIDSVVIANLDAGKITAGTLDAARIGALSITAAKIAAGAIATDKLAALAVTAEKIAAGAVVADKIEAGAVTAVKLAAGAVTADKIEANAITAAKLAADAITGKTITGGTISGTFITGGAIDGVTVQGQGVLVPGQGTGPFAANMIMSGGSLSYERPSPLAGRGIASLFLSEVNDRPSFSLQVTDTARGNAATLSRFNYHDGIRLYDLFTNVLRASDAYVVGSLYANAFRFSATQPAITRGALSVANPRATAGTADVSVASDTWVYVPVPTGSGVTTTNTIADGSAAPYVGGYFAAPYAGWYDVKLSFLHYGNASGNARVGAMRRESAQQTNLWENGVRDTIGPWDMNIAVNGLVYLNQGERLLPMMRQNSGSTLLGRIETMAVAYKGP